MRVNIILVMIIMTISVTSCVEPYSLNNESFEEVLVVEALLTNENKKHIVKLSRTVQLDSNDSSPERVAQVTIVRGDGEEYSFTETVAGTYESDIAFGAMDNFSYKLKIKTMSGELYESREENLPSVAQIDNIYAQAKIRDDKAGVQVMVDGSSTSGEARFFRYEFEETYKIVTPYLVIFDVTIVDTEYQEFDLVFEPRVEPLNVCYRTNYSKGIIQTTALGGGSNVVEMVPVNFIGKEEVKLRDRYSIKIKQYVQSEAAYYYYKVLSDLSNDENIFSNSQPGFVKGNISNTGNNEQVVVGFFEVSSVSSSNRLYFKAEDFGYEKPEYPYNCQVVSLDYADNTTLDGNENQRRKLKELLQSRSYEYLNAQGTAYKLVPIRCSDCTTNPSNTNIMPAFWIE